MHRRRSALLIAGVVLIALAGDAVAQGLGVGSGIDDWRYTKGSGTGPTPCGAMQADQSNTCNSALIALGY